MDVRWDGRWDGRWEGSCDRICLGEGEGEGEGGEGYSSTGLKLKILDCLVCLFDGRKVDILFCSNLFWSHEQGIGVDGDGDVLLSCIKTIM